IGEIVTRRPFGDDRFGGGFTARRGGFGCGGGGGVSRFVLLVAARERDRAEQQRQKKREDERAVGTAFGHRRFVECYFGAANLFVEGADVGRFVGDFCEVGFVAVVAGLPRTMISRP